jgi:hypothetical protein
VLLQGNRSGKTTHTCTYNINRFLLVHAAKISKSDGYEAVYYALNIIYFYSSLTLEYRKEPIAF